MKYMGSKRLIAKYIVPIIQSYINEIGYNYIEPFVGGANVIDKISAKVKYGSDLNKYIIALHQGMQQGKQLYDNVSYELYDKARKNWRNNGDEFDDFQTANIGFLASYNGRWFDGGYAKAGYTANGKYRDYYREAKDNIIKQSQSTLYKDIHFAYLDYRDWSEIVGAVIYCDPPYANTKQYDNAIKFDYDIFWQWCRDMSKDNVVLISEQNAPSDFTSIWEKDVARTMKVEGKFTATEKLFILK